MVQIIKKSALLFASAASLASAQSLLTPIEYEGTLDVYYYFQDSDAIATLSNEGITVEGTFASTEELCQTLNNGQIVYSTSTSGNVLLTSNCFNVFNLVDSENQLISWESCEEFPFYESICGALETSTGTTSTTDATTDATTNPTTDATTGTTTQSNTATAAQTSTNADETFVLSTVTTKIHNVETTYTTWCPISEVTKADENTFTTITEVYTKDGVVSTSTVSAIIDKPIRATIVDVEEYESSLSSSSTKAGTTAVVESTVLVAGSGSTKTETVIQQQGSSSTYTKASSTVAISTFEGQAGRIAGSLSAVYIVGTILAFFL